MKRLAYALVLLVLLIIQFVPSPMLAAAPRAVAVDHRLPNDVVTRWWDLADMYPYAVDQITDIKAVYLPRAGWLVQFDDNAIYVNLGLTRCRKRAAWCYQGRINHADALTLSFAQRAWAWLKREQPQLAWCYASSGIFTTMLLQRVR